MAWSRPLLCKGSHVDTRQQLEQLECLRSEDTPRRPV